MRVRLDIGLDFEGRHTFDWAANDDAGAVDVPKAVLERWSAEREAFKIASLRWKRVMEEVEDTLYKAEQARAKRHVVATAPALAHAKVTR